MSKHTPGPWLWTKSRTGGFAMQGDLNGQSVEIVFRTEDMRQADAHLISAAPELLEELKEARIALTFYREWMAEHVPLTTYPNGEQVEESCRAAIAKAEGR